MTTLINNIPTNELLDPKTTRGVDGLELKIAKVRFTSGWQTLLSQIQRVVLANTLSGTTAQRPTTFLWIGRRFFDTSLGAHGKPIWVAAVSGSGVATWIDATSTVV